MISLEFFISNILPEAVGSGAFGNNAEVVKIVEDSTQGKDQFASTVQFMEILVKVNGDTKIFPVVCKFQCDSAERRDRFQTHLQFFNEVVVYKEILPLFPKSTVDIFPKFYFGITTLDKSPQNDVVMVENLIPSGYRQSSERIFLDFEHCKLAFRKLGQFHAASLTLKKKSPLNFTNKINKLAETRWVDKLKDINNYFYGETAKRGIVPLIKKGEHVEVLNRCLGKLTDICALVKEILEVNEMSVLCHGDFCRNNMVFKYDHDRPIDVKFYDLATARYASPILDISLFLFLNTSPDLRRKHFKNDLLKIYLEAIQEVAGGEALTMTELWEEFQQKALYGYIPSAFFLPIMLDDRPHDVDQSLRTQTLEERVKVNFTRGGEKVTALLSEGVKDLITWGCLK